MCKVQSLTPEWDWPKGMAGEDAACLLSDPGRRILLAAPPVRAERQAHPSEQQWDFGNVR